MSRLLFEYLHKSALLKFRRDLSKVFQNACNLGQDDVTANRALKRYRISEVDNLHREFAETAEHDCKQESAFVKKPLFQDFAINAIVNACFDEARHKIRNDETARYANQNPVHEIHFYSFGSCSMIRASCSTFSSSLSRSLLMSCVKRFVCTAQLYILPYGALFS